MFKQAKRDIENKDESKEEFCGACVAGIAALAGASTAGGANPATQSNKNIRKKIFWTGITITIISIIYLIYAICFKKCKKCE
jgi:hypothetical protein